MEAEEALHAEWQRKAVRVIAASATDVDDCRELLSMLGLDAEVVRGARTTDSAAGKATPKSAGKPGARKTTRRRSAAA